MCRNGFGTVMENMNHEQQPTLLALKKGTIESRAEARGRIFLLAAGQHFAILNPPSNAIMPQAFGSFGLQRIDGRLAEYPGTEVWLFLSQASWP